MENSLSQPQSGAASGQDQAFALFANLVIQQTNMAFMLLGKVPHPETKEAIKDLDSAKLIIDQLEMLQSKTKGNLNHQEDGLLKQSLMTLRMAFVEAVDEKPGSSPSSESPRSGASGLPEQAERETAPPPVEEESRKKFTKKY
ncbi:MAG: DUF1844 domain-containing protein [Verrucomicrobia bacterium]|nr:DUF1844 domain-containing protein [Verrucomicrobiota bacterium]